MVVSAGRLTEEMRNSYRYLREGFSGKYLALYIKMENGVIHYNSELYSTYTDPDIIKTIKISKLRWTGHYEDIGRKSSKETYLTKTRGK